MAQQKRRPANDRAFKKYKLENKRRKNKIRKLENHCKRFPKDEQSAKALEDIKKNGYKDKIVSKGNTPPTVVKIKDSFNRLWLAARIPEKKKFSGRTAAEQLSELLDIPMPQPKKKSKPRITHKKRKNVQKS
jgi:hypothetical protein